MQPDGTNILALETNTGSNLLGLTSMLDDNMWFWRENNAETVGNVDFGWNHFCVQIDAELGGANISWNGGQAQILAEKVLKSQPDHFILTLGNAAHHSTQVSSSQYDGMIANVHILEAEKSLDIRELSSSLCHVSHETYLSWNEMDFECQGVVEILKLKDENVCGKDDKQNILLPKPIFFHEAKKSCQLLKNGTIVEYKSLEEFKYLKNFNYHDQCQQVWTPFSGNLHNDR